MCERIELTPLEIKSAAVESVLECLRKEFANGGAFLAAFRLGADSVFDCFASRNWLLQDEILVRLLCRSEIRQSLPLIQIPAFDESGDGAKAPRSLNDLFTQESPFIFLGKMAWLLDDGGAYTQSKSNGNGSESAELAFSFCRDTFGLRFGEVAYFVNNRAWTPWFFDVNWDWTVVLIDLRERVMWILVVTDTD